jgi:hypothetical protein
MDTRDLFVRCFIRWLIFYAYLCRDMPGLRSQSGGLLGSLERADSNFELFKSRFEYDAMISFQTIHMRPRIQRY